MLKSKSGGKAEGKTGTQMLVAKVVSDWKTHRISTLTSVEMIKKKSSKTTMLLLLDDVTQSRIIKNLTVQYDSGEVYETMKGTFVRLAEIMISCNYLGFQELSGGAKDGIDPERVADRLSVIPFSELHSTVSTTNYAEAQARFKAVLDDPRKPTEYVIKEIGDYIRSEEFQAQREEMGQFLYDACEGMVKQRTIFTNYAGSITLLRKIALDFEDIWMERGKTWEDCKEWISRTLVPFMRMQHRESTHAKGSIRRFIRATLEFLKTRPLIERRKVLKIVETTKLNEDKDTTFAPAFHLLKAPQSNRKPSQNESKQMVILHTMTLQRCTMTVV